MSAVAHPAAAGVVRRLGHHHGARVGVGGHQVHRPRDRLVDAEHLHVEALAQRPHLGRHTAGHGGRLGFTGDGGDDDRCAHLRAVGQREAVYEGDVEHPGLGLGRVAPPDRFGRAVDRGGRGQQQPRQRQHTGVEPLPGPAQRHPFGGLAPAFVHVGVRVELHATQRVVRRHGGGHQVGVQVEAAEDGQVGAQRAAQRFTQVGLDVVDPLGHARSVQLHHQRIERHRGGRGHQFRLQGRVGIGGDRARGLRGSDHQRHHLGADGVDPVEHARRVGAPTAFGQQVVATGDGELGQRSAGGAERVGLVFEADDADASHVSSLRATRMPVWR